MEKKKVSELELAELREDWKAIVRCVFSAEQSVSEEHKEKLRKAKGKTPTEIDRACDEYVAVVVDEILGGNYIQFYTKNKKTKSL